MLINKQNKYSDTCAKDTPVAEVKLNYQEKKLMFDKMKSELESRQV